jgi:transglutaminase-like putative cysteine protease
MRNHLLASWAAFTLVAACSGPTKTDSLEPVDTHRKHRSFEFVYEAATEAVPAGAREVRLWLPLPTNTRDQRIEDVRIEASHPYVRNEVENGFGESLCVTSAGEPIRVAVRFRATRYETKGGGAAAGAELRAALEPSSMIPLDGKVAAVAAGLPTASDPVATGKVLYQHTLDRMKYDKPADGGGWGRGDAEWACDAKYGNCTDFHSYFIGLARAKGIPARFEMGFSVPAGGEATAKVAGYHCWAYFWSDANGWVPVDISEADKDSTKAEYYFGTLDENRVTMIGGRDVLLTPRPKKGALNFFVYPYAEADGVELKEIQRSFARTNL